MKKLLVVLLVTIGMGAFAQDQEVKQRFIEVQGSSKIEVTPDIVYFSLLLADNPKENIKLEKQEIELAKILKKYGVPSENLTIDKLSGIRQKVSFWGGKEVVNSKTYQLKLTNLSNTDKIVEELSDIKISSIALAKVESSRIEEFKLAACESAAKNAKEKAAAFAKGMGATALSALTVYEQNLFVSGEEEEYQPRMLMMAKAYNDESSRAEAEPQQAFKNIVVKCSVRVRVEIK